MDTSNANIVVGTNALVGANAGAFANTLTNPTLVVQSNAVDYSQIAFRNLGTNANSSTDIIAYADTGDDDSGWIDMGITSNNFSDPGFTITGANDGYIFMEAPAKLVATVSNKALTNNVATLTTSAAHNFNVGRSVLVAGVDATFNGTYTITSVPTTTTFRYTKTNANVASTAVSPVGSAAAADSIFYLAKDTRVENGAKLEIIESPFPIVATDRLYAISGVENAFDVVLSVQEGAN
jgi:hypothetical protein